MKLLNRLTVILAKVVFVEVLMVLEESDESDPCRLRVGSWGVDDTRLFITVGVVDRHSFRELFTSTDVATSGVAASLDPLAELIFHAAIIRKQIGV